jgi:hypothetical protein
MRTIVTVILLATALSGCAHVQTLPPAELALQNVIEAPGASKERIFEKSKVWFARTFRQSMSGWIEQNSRRTVLQYENKENGVLIANGAIPYPHAGFTDESYKTGWEVRFTLEVDARDGKAKVAFNHLTMFVPSIVCGYYSYATSSYERPLYADELEKAKPAFQALADQFGAYLKIPEETW